MPGWPPLWVTVGHHDPCLHSSTLGTDKHGHNLCWKHCPHRVLASAVFHALWCYRGTVPLKTNINPDGMGAPVLTLVRGRSPRGHLGEAWLSLHKSCQHPCCCPGLWRLSCQLCIVCTGPASCQGVCLDSHLRCKRLQRDPRQYWKQKQQTNK